MTQANHAELIGRLEKLAVAFETPALKMEPGRTYAFSIPSYDPRDNVVADLRSAAQAIAGLERELDAAREALTKIAEDRYSAPRYAEDTDTDYFLRWIKSLKDQARSALLRALAPS